MNSSSTTTSTEGKSKLVPRSAYVLELWLFVMAFLAAKSMGWTLAGGAVVVPLVVLAVRGLMDPPSLASRHVADVVPHAAAALFGVGVIVSLCFLPGELRRDAARRYGRQLEAQFGGDVRYQHIRITQTGAGGGGVIVSGELRRGDLSELKRIVRAGSPADYIEYHVTELDPAKYELADAEGELTPRRDVPLQLKPRVTGLLTQQFFDLVVYGYLTLEERHLGRRRFGGVEPDRVQAWPIAALAGWLPDDVLTIDDTNLTPSVRTFTRPEAIQQLQSRQGPLHEHLAGVAHLRTEKDVYLPDKEDTDPMAQRIRMFAAKDDSKLVERTDGKHVVAELGKNDTEPTYRLTFKVVGDQLKLSRIEYTVLEEDCRDPGSPETPGTTKRMETPPSPISDPEARVAALSLDCGKEDAEACLALAALFEPGNKLGIPADHAKAHSVRQVAEELLDRRCAAGDSKACASLSKSRAVSKPTIETPTP
jgi:hypothetical protein